jgi:glycine betaine/choline ABC-type transport system substrate-binding protein
MIIIPAILESLVSRKDKSFRLTFGTNELTPDKVGSLASINQKFCFLAIKDQEFDNAETLMIDSIDVDLYDDKSKTQSQRIRSVLFVNFQQNNDGYKEFKEYYRFKTEQIIEHYKSKLT